MHQTSVFRGHVEQVARYYHPVSMDAVQRFLRGCGDLPMRAAAVTFDDGYRDNYELAAPILEKASIPATFYVTVDCVESGKLPWVSRLRYAFATTRRGEWRNKRAILLSIEGKQREKTYLLACDYCATLSGAEQRCFVASVEGELGDRRPRAPSVSDDDLGTRACIGRARPRDRVAQHDPS